MKEDTKRRNVIQNKILIPGALKNAIDALNLSNIMKGKAYKLCSILLEKSNYNHRDFSAYIHLSVKYLEKTFGKDYHKGFFNLLKNKGIIECDQRYIQGSVFRKGISKSYRVKPKLLNDDLVEIYSKEKNGEHSNEGININMTYDVNTGDKPNFNERPKNISKEPDNYYLPITNYPINTTILYSSTLLSSNSTTDPNLSSSYLHISTRVFPKQLIFDDMDSLSFDLDKLNKAVDNAVAYISTCVFKTGDQVSGTHFEVKNHLNGHIYYTKKESAIEWCKKHSADLIQDGNSYSIDSLNNFIERRKLNVRLYYKWQIAKLQYRHYFADTNGTNGRLDHNFSVMPKALLAVIKEDNQLVEIDIRNSQFAIHAYWMKHKGLCNKYGDVQEYYRLCSSGNLYDELASKMNITRQEAKILMMELAFSSTRSMSQLKTEFGKFFPNVLAHIDAFKKEKKESRYFAIELQQLESEIFVDNLYPNIKRKGLFCLTRHDSLLVRKEDAETIVEIMQDYFIYLGLECAISVNDKVRLLKQEEEIL